MASISGISHLHLAPPRAHLESIHLSELVSSLAVLLLLAAVVRGLYIARTWVRAILSVMKMRSSMVSCDGEQGSLPSFRSPADHLFSVPKALRTHGENGSKSGVLGVSKLGITHGIRLKRAIGSPYLNEMMINCNAISCPLARLSLPHSK